ncbi:MAG TPA: twin-arginine translocase TatA/TatE family subunit [Solirubrobacteraceae bacterium]|jgi:sec-independent protein translocase protein TatA|nr:twin-arginine translocase TatA/TatE family subunit [Solirubrobacteraceae bacterium]
MGLDNPLHIIFLLLILVLVFGAKRVPEMGRSLGEGLRGFKDGMSSPHAPAQTLTSAPEAQVVANEAAANKVPVA